MVMPGVTAIIGARWVRSALFRRFEHQSAEPVGTGAGRAVRGGMPTANGIN